MWIASLVMMVSTLATAEVTAVRMNAKIIKIDGKFATVQVGNKRMQIDRHHIPKDAASGTIAEVKFTPEEFAKIVGKPAKK